MFAKSEMELDSPLATCKEKPKCLNYGKELKPVG